MKAVDLRCEHMIDPLGIDIIKPVLSWSCEGGKKQKAYRLIAKNEDEVLFDTGKVETNKTFTAYEGKAVSRSRIFWHVILWDEEEKMEESEEAFFEYGLLNKEFEAKWICPEEKDPSADRFHPASYLINSFEVNDFKKARIYATAHGIYNIYLNGERVMENVLTPGTSEYWYRLPYQVFDIAKYLHKGNNRIEVTLGEGWYRGCNGNTGTRHVFGDDLALLLQVELDEKVVLKSDESWKACQDGPIYFNDIQLGEKVDARKNIENYHVVRIMDFGYDNLICANTVAIKEKESFPARLIHTPDGNKVLDFSQNLAGWISFRLNAKEGQKLKITLGEYLDEEGYFSDKNFETIGRKEPLHQVIEYTCKEGLNEYKSQFCISGFQYALIETDIEITGEEFLSHAVYSDIALTSKFECDNKLVNKLFENAIWSTKSNFVDIPTDCPQRERSGWTGDAALYAYTGLRVMDTYPVYRKWLGEERVVQYEDGRVRNFAPRRSRELSFMDKLYDGSTAWGDCSVIVPYEMYKLNGDKKILEENYIFMKRWLQYCEKKARKSRLKNIFDPYRKYIIDTGIHYGEWLEAGISMADGMKEILFKGIPEVATAYFASSCRMMKEIAAILNKKEDEGYYEKLYQKTLEAYRHLEIEKDAIYKTDRQCRLIRPLQMGLLDENDTKKVAARLNELVVNNGYHLNTGFLTTPHICRVLADNGYIETAYRLLLQESTPGWLFAVKNGATTIWESWEGYFGDIGVASLNHYSKGAVASWLLDGICGINVSYDKITIRPEACRLMKYARASVKTEVGEIISGWEYEGDELVFEVTIPSNREAEFIYPDGRKAILEAGTHKLTYSVKEEEDA